MQSRQTFAGMAGRARTCLMAGAVLAAGAALAQSKPPSTGMYQWKDEQGRIHWSDKPPEDASQATKVTPGPGNVAPASKAVQQRALADRQASKAPPEAASPASAPPLPTAANANAPRPGETDCQRRQREYQASMACFVPFRNAAGAISPEADKKCGPALPEPAPCS